MANPQLAENQNQEQDNNRQQDKTNRQIDALEARMRKGGLLKDGETFTAKQREFLRSELQKVNGDMATFQQELKELLGNSSLSQLTAGNEVKVDKYSTVTYHLRNNCGVYHQHEAHLAFDKNTGELVTWANSGKMEGGKPKYTWQNAEQVPGMKFTALYVNEGKVYDSKGNEVQMLNPAGSGGQVSAKFLASQLELKVGQLSTMGERNQIHSAQYQGKIAVFTRGLPPGLRSRETAESSQKADVETSDAEVKQDTDSRRRTGEKEQGQEQGQGQGQGQERNTTRASYDTISYHTQANGMYYQREVHLRISKGSNGGTLERWDGTKWTNAGISRYPERRVSCLYCVNGKAYDARGKEVHSISDGGYQRNVNDVLKDVTLEQGRVSTLPSGRINTLQHNGQMVVFTEGPPPGFDLGFFRSVSNGDVAARVAMLRKNKIKSDSYGFDVRSGEVRFANGKTISGFVADKDASGKITGATWSAKGSPQLKIVKGESGWEVQRRVHQQQRDAWGNLTGVSSTWVKDPTKTITQ